MKHNSDWIEQAVQMYEQGTKYYKIAKALDVDRHTVSVKLRELGYQSDLRYVRNNIPLSKLRKYDYTTAETVFEKIDTEEKAYWLGFLYADGYVSSLNNQITLSLAEVDKTHVERFRHFVGLDNKPLHKKIKGTFVSYEMQLCSGKVKQDLIRLGCGPRKTFQIQFPTENQVPYDLIKHFIRGYLDGDGSVTTSSCSKIVVDIVGTYDFLEKYQQWVGLHINKIHPLIHTKGVYHSMYGGIAAIYILDMLYEDATIFLERKYTKYLELRRLRLTTVRRPKSMIAELSKKGLTDPDLRLKALVAEATESSATHSS